MSTSWAVPDLLGTQPWNSTGFLVSVGGELGTVFVSCLAISFRPLSCHFCLLHTTLCICTTQPVCKWQLPYRLHCWRSKDGEGTQLTGLSLLPRGSDGLSAKPPNKGAVLQVNAIPVPFTLYDSSASSQGLCHPLSLGVSSPVGLFLTTFLCIFSLSLLFNPALPLSWWAPTDHVTNIPLPEAAFRAFSMQAPKCSFETLEFIGPGGGMRGREQLLFFSDALLHETRTHLSHRREQVALWEGGACSYVHVPNFHG